MEEKKVVRTSVTAADMDAAGYVTVWDHGPQEPPEAAEAWHKEHGVPAVPHRMLANEAGHAITVEPQRYALEPAGIDEGAVTTKVNELRHARKATEDAAAKRQADAQLIADRREAIAAVMAEHHVKVAADKAARAPAARGPAVTERRGPPAPRPPVRTGADVAAEIEAKRKADADAKAKADAEARNG